MAKSGFSGARNEQALYENIEKLTGQRGNGLDRAITVRELNALGLVHVKRRAGGGVNVTPAPTTRSPNDGLDLPSQMPSAPVNLQVSGGFGSIMLTWDVPDYLGHAYTEVWRASTNNIDTATLIATVSASAFGDIVATGAAFYYWVRHVNIKDIPGPYNDRVGVQGKTSEDIENVADRIGEQLGASKLVKELNEKGTSAFQSMWNQKAQAGDIKAGIGILADSSGKSQVAVSASQFFVFDPNSDTPMQPLFAIDQGSVVIPQAMIKSATIQILQSETIIADEVRAGISVSSPIINGARISGGEALFGEGGPYGGYQTRISNNGLLETDNINARGNLVGSRIDGGEIHGAEIHGVTIYGGTLVQLITKYQVEGALEYSDGSPVLAEHSITESFNTISPSSNPWTGYLDVYPYNHTHVKTEKRLRWSTIGNESSTSGIVIAGAGKETYYDVGAVNEDYSLVFEYEDKNGTVKTSTHGITATEGNSFRQISTPVGKWTVRSTIYVTEGNFHGPDMGKFSFEMRTVPSPYVNKLRRVRLVGGQYSIVREVKSLSAKITVRNYEKKP